MTFSSFDLVLAAILALVVVKATIAGFVTEFFSKAATVAGVACALFFFRRLSPIVVKFLGAEVYPDAIAFLAIFLAAYLVVKGVQQLAGTAFESESMTNLDRALGFFLGIAEGLVVVAAIIAAIRAQPWIDLAWLTKDSFFMRYMGPMLFGSAGIIGDLVR